MVFIDWFSPKNHQRFNKNFYSLFFFRGDSLIVSNPDLLSNMKIIQAIFQPSNNRFVTFIRVLRQLLISKNKDIFFISYDPLLLPLLRPFCNKIFVFEHNTVPDKNENFKIFFQKTFYRNIIRFTQFQAQYDALITYGLKNIFHLGLPITNGCLKRRNYQICNEPKSLLILSERLTNTSLSFILNNICSDYPIYIKDNKNLNKNLFKDYPHKLYFKAWIDIDQLNVAGIIIGVDSNIRGSGWFEESISLGLPLIFAYPSMHSIFEKDFPEIPTYLLKYSRATLQEFLNNFPNNDFFEDFTYKHNQKLSIKFENYRANLL